MTAKRTALFRSLSTGLLAGLLMAGVALAHHGWTGYNEKTELSLTGVIEEANYINPHGMIRLKVTSPQEKTWIAVLAPPSRMTARGLSQEMLKVGSTATVVGYQHMEKQEEMRAERITVAGKTVELR